MSKYEIDYEKGIMNVGDTSRLIALMQRAMKGEEITVGFLGGSITQGSLSSTPQLCYAYLVYQWWVQKFPNAKFTYMNAGIGGTTSQFGVSRVQSDLLSYKPDFAIIEFSVNDDNNEFYRETYEGLVRTVYSNEKLPAVMLLHNVCYDTMNSAEDQHLMIGKAYKLPCVSLKSTLYPKVADGTIPNREVTPDDLHPNDAGHAIVAGVVTHFLDQIYAKTAQGEQPGPISAEMPAPLTANQYEHSVRYQSYNSTPVMYGFEPDLEPQNTITEPFHKGFTGWKQGASIEFKIAGTGIAVQYRKSVKQPTPIAKVVVDGDEEHAMILDGNFKETWGDCIYIDTVTRHTEDREHSVKITIVEAHEDDAVPFYLVSVIGSRS